MNKDDLRAQRTFHKINKFFKILMGEVGYEKINIAMITKRANMNRSTYYSHFSDKRHLYEYHIGLIADSFSRLTLDEVLGKEKINKERRDSLLDHFEDTLIQMQEEKDYFLAMTEVERPEEMSQTWVKHFNVNLNNQFIDTKHGVKVPVMLLVDYAVSMFFLTLTWWFNESPETKPRDVAEFLLDIFLNLPLVKR